MTATSKLCRVRIYSVPFAAPTCGRLGKPSIVDGVATTPICNLAPDHRGPCRWQL